MRCIYLLKDIPDKMKHNVMPFSVTSLGSCVQDMEAKRMRIEELAKAETMQTIKSG